MFGGAEQELYMQNAIDERRLLLEDREDGFRRQLERMAREEHDAHSRRRAGGWLVTVARTVRSMRQTKPAGTSADSTA